MLASTWVSMMWNMSAPLPTSLLGILISTVDPGSLLGPLFIAYVGQTGEKRDKKIEKYSACWRFFRL